MRALLGASLISIWTSKTMASASSYLFLCWCCVFWMQVVSLPSQLANANQRENVAHQLLADSQTEIQGRKAKGSGIGGWIILMGGMMAWMSLIGIKAIAFKALLVAKVALTLGFINLIKKLSYGTSGKEPGGVYLDHSVEGYESPPWESGGTLDFQPYHSGHSGHSGGGHIHHEEIEEWPSHISHEEPVTYKEPPEEHHTSHEPEPHTGYTVHEPHAYSHEHHSSHKQKPHKGYRVHEQSYSHEEDDNVGYQSWDNPAITKWNEQYNDKSVNRGYNHMQFSDNEENRWNHKWKMDEDGLSRKSDDETINNVEWKPLVSAENDTYNE